MIISAFVTGSFKMLIGSGALGGGGLSPPPPLL